MTQFLLYDLYPKQTGIKRFVISINRMENKRLICIDKAYQKLNESRKLLLKDWEGITVPKNQDLPPCRAFPALWRPFKWGSRTK